MILLLTEFSVIRAIPISGRKLNKDKINAPDNEPGAF